MFFYDAVIFRHCRTECFVMLLLRLLEPHLSIDEY